MIERHFDPNQRHRYAIYARMSSERQNPRSPDQQIEVIRRLVKQKQLPWEHVKDYRDDAISGRLVRKRPGLGSLLDDIAFGRINIDLIIVDTFERFGRVDELSDIRKDLMNRRGILLLTADTQFADPTTVQGRVLSFVEGFRATSDNRVKSHNVSRGKRDAAQNNLWPGGPVPFGYKLQHILESTNGIERKKSTLVPNPATSSVVRQIFEKAAETGWGAARLAEHFNRNPEFPVELKPISQSRIAYMLRNAIYRGEMIWGRLATDIVDDRRVVEARSEEEVVHVANFCDPIVPDDLWNEVTKLREHRRRHSRTRQSKPAPGKLNRPIAPGLSVKFLLAGLVICGHCRRAMTASGSKPYRTKAGEENRYIGYACPARSSGECPNRQRVPEDWLRRQVVSLIYKRVFGLELPDNGNMELSHDAIHASPRFEDLMREVEAECRRLLDAGISPTDGLEQEKAALEKQLDGWIISLSDPELSSSVRLRLQREFSNVESKIHQIDEALLHATLSEERSERILDKHEVSSRLMQLDRILGTNNATRANIELALHIDSISCFSDGTVIVRTCKLGALAKFQDLVRAETRCGDVSNEDDAKRVKPRRRSVRAIDGFGSAAEPLKELAHLAANVDRFAGLEDRWFWEDTLNVPPKSNFATRHHEEVHSYRLNGGNVRSLQEVAKHFGVSIPTVRSALKEHARRNNLESQLPA